MTTNDRLLRIDQVSAWTGISENTLRWWRAKGEGGPQSAKLGRRVVYRQADVEAWIDAQFEASA